MIIILNDIDEDTFMHIETLPFEEIFFIRKIKVVIILNMN